MSKQKVSIQHINDPIIKCNTKTLLLILLIIMVAVVSVNKLHAMGTHGSVDEKKLYIFSTRELSKFFKGIGYPDLWYNDIRISRNSDGTALRFMNERKKKIIIVTCDGNTTILDSPGYLTWLNDANQVIVWLTWTDNKSMAHYINGMSEKLPFHPQGGGPDPSGKYFIKTDLNSPASQSCHTSIFLTEKPNIPVAKADVCGATRIFYKDAKIFLTGRQYRDGNLQDEEILVFKEKENAVELIDRIIVPSPNKSNILFYAIDISPWDEEMLFIDAYDFPARSIWYSFDMKTHQLKKIGKVPWFGGQAFYLQCDIMKRATERVKEQKR